MTAPAGIVQTMGVLNGSTLLMSLYGTYSIGWAANDLFQRHQVESWAAWAVIAFGVLLVLAALVTRSRVPGGLPMAAAALLGLQALDVHNAAHLETPLWAQLGRAVVGGLLLGLAFYGGLPARAAIPTVKRAADTINQRPRTHENTN